MKNLFNYLQQLNHKKVMGKGEMITVVEGRFFKDSKPMPLEFGNKEQIQYINKRLKFLEATKNGGFEVEPDYEITEITIEASVNWTCVCGARLNVYATADYEDDIDCFVGHDKTCHKCHKEYELIKNDDEKIVVISIE